MSEAWKCSKETDKEEMSIPVRLSAIRPKKPRKTQKMKKEARGASSSKSKVEPYPRRTFPLSDEVYAKMLKGNSPGHPVPRTSPDDKGVKPYPRRTFPLSDEVYAKMLRGNSPGHPVPRTSPDDKGTGSYLTDSYSEADTEKKGEEVQKEKPKKCD